MSRFLSGTPHWLYDTTFFTENVSILMSFLKEDADVDYISLDLHLIKCITVSVRVVVFLSSRATSPTPATEFEVFGQMWDNLEDSTYVQARF